MTISSEVPSLGKRRHNILFFEELSPKISLFDMKSNLPLTSLTTTGGCFNFGSSSFYFFERKRCLTPCPHVVLYP